MYSAIWDYGGATFSNRAGTIHFDEAVGSLEWAKVYSSESYNEATGRIIKGNFLGWNVIITIKGLSNQDSGDSDNFLTLIDILQEETIDIRPRDPNTAGLATIEFRNLELVSSFGIEDIDILNKGQLSTDLVFRNLLPLASMSKIRENVTQDLYVDENGDSYVDEDGDNYIGATE